MRTDAGVQESLWVATEELPGCAPLTRSLTADVCIVGAGISGLTTAYQLALEGRSVVVLEDGAVGGGDTCRTSAHLTNAIDDGYVYLERLHGREGARLAAESHGAAIDEIERIVCKEGLECDFSRVDGYLVGSREVLEAESEAATRAGLGVELLDRLPVNFYDFGPALRFPRQAQFHTVRYLNGLLAACQRLGVQVFGRTKADQLEGGERVRVQTSTGHQIEAGSLVLATNAPAGDLVSITARQAAYRSYCIALRVPLNSLAPFLLWDSEDPYHYVRLQKFRDHAQLVVGGEDHRVGQAEEEEGQRFGQLEVWARERFPMAGTVDFRWSGQILEPVDCLGYCGPQRDQNLFIATGDSGHGLTQGTLAGLLLRDLILGRENPWASLYSPSRLTLRAGLEFARENINSAWQYTDHLTPGDVDGEDQIAAGCGAVVRQGFKQLAVYRQPDGSLTRLSAVCPHLGGIVHWNDVEKSWDCPCHGSRFAPDGHVVNGPANAALKPAD